MNRLTSIIWIVIMSGCYAGEELADIPYLWPYAQPEEVGFQSEPLLALNTAIEKEAYGDISGVVMVKDDQLFFENYYNGLDRGTLRPLGTATFGILVLLMDHFLQDGKISLDDPIHLHLPDYQTHFETTPDKKKITIRHLLEHRSGLAWDESVVNGQNANSDINRMKRTTDWVSYVLQQPIEAQPGLRTVLNSGSGMILAKIMEDQLLEGSLLDWIKSNLFDPIGIEHFEWSTSYDGLINATDGLFLSTLDYTKMGYILLNEGRWIEKQRVFGRDWTQAVVTPYRQITPAYSLGYGWQIFSKEFLEENYTTSEAIYFQPGAGGQNLYIVPDQNLVVCITAANYFFDEVYNPSLYLFLRTLQSTFPAKVN